MYESRFALAQSFVSPWTIVVASLQIDSYCLLECLEHYYIEHSTYREGPD